MIKIDFIKMHGLGNDFVIIEDKLNLSKKLSSSDLKKIASRNFGIGCDQILIINNYDKESASVSIYNSDGIEAGTCGNGIRCVAKHLMKKLDITEISIQTVTGDLHCWRKNDICYVNMGKPRFEWDKIPLSKNMETNFINIEGYQLFCLSMGNPHGVIFFENLNDLNKLNIEKIGPIIQSNKHFPNGINIEFVTILNDKTLRMKVWERGAGKTLACGSGACATLIAACEQNLSDRRNIIVLDGGKLEIDWQKNGDVIMSGEVKSVFEGIYNCE